VDNVLLYSRYREDLEYRVGHYKGCVKIDCNDRYYCIRKMIVNENDLLA